MKDLNVTLVQSPLHWENTDKNLEMFSRKIAAINERTDLVILPEMFSTGFTMNVSLAEKTGEKTMAWMKKTAAEKNCVVTGSIIIEENGKAYNRLVWQRPDGTFELYDKKHLFRYANEQQHYTAGNNKLIAHLGGWKICPMICYDLRFPVWIRNRVKTAGPDHSPVFDYDALIFVANWPGKRSHAWKTLLQARAMENQCYVIGVNRVGNDGNDFSYSGDSVALNPKGEAISKLKANEDLSETVTFSASELEEWRKSFPAWMDADEFKLVPGSE